MPKTVDEKDLTITFALRKSADGVSIACDVSYTVSSDDLTETRALKYALSDAEKAAVVNLAKKILGQVKKEESV